MPGIAIRAAGEDNFMNKSSQKLQIKIHETNGTATSFDQNDPALAKAILEGFDPTELINRETLIIGDERSHSTIPVSQVTRVDFTSGTSPLVIFRDELVEALELTKLQFEALIRNRIMGEQWQQVSYADKSIVVFLEVTLGGNQSVLLTMDMKFDSVPNIGEIQEYLLQRSGLCFRMQNGGVAVINLANLTRLTFFPGCAEPADKAWPASFSHWISSTCNDLSRVANR
jgi:hypothetical protein